MMDNDLISIIVPVYNATDYLDKCLHSIQMQSWRNIEVWLVNDGSRDNSLDLCKRIASTDQRFHVINQENSGVSAARNAALRQANGRYLQFVDSDDFLPLNATECLVRAARATGSDLTIAHFYRVIGDHQVKRGHIKEKRIFTRHDFAEEMMKAPANYYYGALWNKLYRRNIAEANNICFAQEVKWCEDLLFNLEYIRYARLIVTIPDAVYYYVKRQNSLVSKQTPRKIIDMKQATFAYYKKLYCELDMFDENRAHIYGYFLSVAKDGSHLKLPERPTFLRKENLKLKTFLHPLKKNK